MLLIFKKIIFEKIIRSSIFNLIKNIFSFSNLKISRFRKKVIIVVI